MARWWTVGLVLLLAGGAACEPDDALPPGIQEVAQSGSGAFGMVSSSSAATGGGGMVGQSGIRLTVLKHTLQGGYFVPAPAPGTRLVRLEIQLENVFATEAASLSSMHFRGRTAGALEVSASPATAELAGACADTLSVNTGGQRECGLLFEIPNGETLTSLTYGYLELSAVANVPPLEAPATCDGLEVVAAERDAGNTACPFCIGDNLEMGPCAPLAIAWSESDCTGAEDCYTMCFQEGGQDCDCDEACMDLAPACFEARDAFFACALEACAAECYLPNP